MDKASLVLVGSGIKFLSHLTIEAKAYIEQSDVVLYLVNDPIMKEWIKGVNPAAQSLENIYNKFPLRMACYQAITNHILEITRQNQHVCVVLYGHPTMFAKPGLDAVKQAKEEGFFVKVLPAISAEACLFADMLIDPGSNGCQSFETTDFLIYKRTFDPTCHIILWQVDIIGALNNPEPNLSGSSVNEKGLNLLLNYLNGYYELEHQVTLYEAAQYPGFESRIENFPLYQLPKINFLPISSLYIPPFGKKTCDDKMLNSLSKNFK